MDESWKFWPAQGHPCPVCSTPHFPFCSMPPPPPPPHAFDRYRPTVADFHRFPPSMRPPFPHNPPFWDHRLPPPPMPYPPESWGLHHAPEREAFRPVIHPPPQRFLPDELLGGESSYKRMRVEGPPMGTLHPPQSYDRPEFVPGMFSADDERRLNLIRDHGKQKAMERLPQSNGELLPDKSARDVLLNQYHDVGADHGFDGPKFSSVGRGGPLLPQDRKFDPPIQFMRPKPFEGHHNFSGALGSHGDERFVSHERLNFERVGSYNSHLSEYNSAHCERKDSGGGTGVGDYPNVGHNHSNVSFQRLDSYKDGSAVPNPDYNTLQGQPKKYNCPDLQEVHPPKDSPYMLPQPQFSQPGSYNLLQDRTGKKDCYPGFEDSTEHRLKHPCEQTEATRALPETILSDVNDTQKPLKPANYSLIEESNAKTYVVQGLFPLLPGINNSDGMTKEMQVRMHTHGVYPSLSTSLPAGHLDPSLKHAPRSSPSPGAPPVSLFPVLVGASAMSPVLPNKTYPDPHALPQSSGYKEISPHPSTEIANKDLTFINQAPLKLDGAPKVPVSNSLKIKPTIVDACDLFKQPRCASRPDHIVIILRGLPGSGKSYLAKALRDLEIENGGNTPRIHAMDDYFMIEVEKTVDDSEGSKPSGVSRVKKQTAKKVIEYCYELEMEEAYRSSMLKAFKKTLEEGIFTFVIVDDRNLRVADFAQFWAIAKRSGYEVYLLDAPYKDPAGCAARNVHGFTLGDIQKMAEKWEEAPPIYLQLDIQSLFHGDNMNEHSIQEVDMDITDSDCDDNSSKLQNEDKESLKPVEPKPVTFIPDQDLSKVGERWESDEEEEEQTRVKELGSSKWSKDLDEDDEKSKGVRGNLNALSGLIQAYSKGGKSVHWGDQSDKSGFSIGVVKKKSSLIIGPGAGYNLTSNPLTEDQVSTEATESSSASESRRQFSEKLRAEHESIRAVLRKRQQRIGGFFNIEDD